MRGENQAFLRSRKHRANLRYRVKESCCALTSIFADARFFLMTLFSEYCSVAMMAYATKQSRENSRAARGGYIM